MSSPNACGVAACVPTLVGHLWHRGFYHSVCADCYELAGTGAPALWAVLFCFSKLAELFEALLVVVLGVGSSLTPSEIDDVEFTS